MEFKVCRFWGVAAGGSLAVGQMVPVGCLRRLAVLVCGGSGSCGSSAYVDVLRPRRDSQPAHILPN
jgi:hypothetical protein